MPGGNTFVAEIAVDFKYLFHAADYQPFQIKLWRDAQIQRHIQRVMMRHKRPCGGAARNRVHHRRFDFQIIARDKKLAHRLDDFRACGENLTCVFVGDQIQIALAVFLFLIGQAVEFLRQRPQRFGQQLQAGYADRQLAGLGFE